MVEDLHDSELQWAPMLPRLSDSKFQNGTDHRGVFEAFGLFDESGDKDEKYTIVLQFDNDFVSFSGNQETFLKLGKILVREFEAPLIGSRILQALLHHIDQK